MNKVERPDIFWIVSDEYRYDGVGENGPSWLKTPNLDRLAEEGVIFRNAFCQTPVCVASRASFMSGKYSHNTGNTWFDYTSQDVTFFTEYLVDKANYLTVGFGKEHHNRYNKRRYPSKQVLESAFLMKFPDRKQSYDVKTQEFKQKEAELNIIRRKYFGMEPGIIISGTNPLSPEKALTGHLVGEALDYLKSYNQERPLLFRVSTIYPHTPILPPKPFDSLYSPEDMVFDSDKFEDVKRSEFDRTIYEEWGNLRDVDYEGILKMRAHYYGLCSYVDAQLGLMLDYLRENWKRPYVVIFHSDHGSQLGQHGLSEKMSMYDESIKVPLIISGHNIPKGKVIDEFAELVDLAPTLLNYTGVEPSPEMEFDGRNLLDIINNPGVEWRDDAFCEGNFMSAPHMMFSPFYPFVQTEIEGVRGWEYEKLEKIAEEKGLDLRKLEGGDGPYKYWRPLIQTVRTERYSLSVRAIWREGQGDDYMGSLYDLKNDPHEAMNLFDDVEYYDVRNGLIEKIKKWDSK